MKIEYRCEECGSNNLEFMFFTTWDFKTQSFTKNMQINEYENPYCEKCEERVDYYTVKYPTDIKVV